MKGIHPLLAAMLLVVITLAAISIVFDVGSPLIGRSKEILVFEEAKNNLISMDNSINSVSYQGEGAARLLKITVTDGEYTVDADSDEISFIMKSPNQVYGVGVSNITDNINITGLTGEIMMTISFDKVDILSGGIFGSGDWTVGMSNAGYDPISDKQEIDVVIS